jgi:hypothetical protein
MSRLRECDRHGGSFSERDEGWAEGNLIIHRRYQDGSRNDESIKVDYCQACVKILQGNAPEGTTPDHYHHEETPRRAIPYDPAYTAQMERQSLFDSPYSVDGPRPGDKITDHRDGSTKTVLQPEQPGIACVCGIPTFGEHYHGPGLNRNPEFPVFGDGPAPGSGDLD